MKKKKRWKHKKEFDTQTLVTGINQDTGESGSENTTANRARSRVPSNTQEAIYLKNLTAARTEISNDRSTQVYEPRPLTPDDEMYEDILEQFASAPTKPKYWFEEFGDYWSCSCGHINKGAICKSCGLERELLRTLFFLHKPAGAPGDLNKKIKKGREQADKEAILQEEIDRRKEASGSDINDIKPIEPYHEADEPNCEPEHNKPEPPQDSDELEDDLKNAGVSLVAPVAAEPQENALISNTDEKITPSGKSVPVSAKSALRINKRLIIIISAIIVIIALISVGTYFIYKNYAAPAMLYDDARKLQESGKYLKAIEKYEELGNYRDSAAMIRECYIGIGDNYYNEGKFKKAIETYNVVLKMKESDDIHDKIWKCHIGIGDRLVKKGKYSSAIKKYKFALTLKESSSLHNKIWKCYISIGDVNLDNGDYESALTSYREALDIKDSEKLRNKIYDAKFLYVQAHQSDGGEKFEEYMMELMDIKYSGIQEIYDEYYAWRIGIVANNSDSDHSSDMSTVSRNDTVYFHISVNGGEPGETISFYYEASWPDGSSEVYEIQNEWEAGSYITARFQYPMPLFGQEGELTFNLYNSATRELMGSDSIVFKN